MFNMAKFWGNQAIVEKTLGWESLYAISCLLNSIDLSGLGCQLNLQKNHGLETFSFRQT